MTRGNLIREGVSMDCRTAQLLASLTGPGKSELDADQMAALEGHMRLCELCGKVYHREKAFDREVGKAMKAVPVPTDLKDRILQKVRPRLQPWYRRRNVVASFATAAAVLIGLWFVVGPAGRSRLDIQRVVERQIQPSQKELAVRWLDSQKIAFHPEFAFNLDLVAFYGNRDFMGRDTPSLLLFHPEKQVSAQIFILKSGQFDWDDIPEDFSAYGLQIKKIADRERPTKIAYLVFFATESLEPFQDRASGA